MSQTKKRVAVFFGGRSPEHDVSVVTGLQVLQAVDPSLYDAFPVYISPDGQWYVGDILRERASYMIDKINLKTLTPVTLDVNVQDSTNRKGVLLATKARMFGGNVVDTFDVALPCFHGLYGEDGNIQGLFELVGVPYTGMRTMASAILMDKVSTKHVLKSLGIPALDYAVLRRPAEGYLIPESELKDVTKDLKFPCILKPSHLGSSIGVAKVNAVEEINACLPAIFEFDDAAILEPFVENLVEYNAAVANISGTVQISAIERPKTDDELLDFKQKYMSGGDNKSGGSKNPGQISEGMLSLTRELNPDISNKQRDDIENWAITLFEAMDGTGAPRIDFIGNSKTGELWLNEINPFPGSCGYFLWEVAPKPLLFTELLNNMIEEAFEARRGRALPKDPVPMDARLFRRPL